MNYTEKHLTVNSFSLFIEGMGEWRVLHETHYQSIIQAYKDKSWDAFQKSEMIGRIIAGPVILTMRSAFSKGFLLKNHLPPALFLGFDLSGWRVLI